MFKMIMILIHYIAKQLKILQPGTCLAFGSAFKVPIMIRLDMPDPPPSSDSCNISSEWFGK